jgi:hypothetical protein
MKTHTETIEVQIPNGYRCTGYRAPIQGESAVHSSDGSIFTCESPTNIYRKLILEKTHTPPELVLCLESGLRKNTQWVAIRRSAATPTRVLSERFELDGCVYSLILARNPSGGAESVWLGHWNDGLEPTDLEPEDLRF